MGAPEFQLNKGFSKCHPPKDLKEDNEITRVYSTSQGIKGEILTQK